MPELPEVEVIKNELQAKIRDEIIQEFNIIWPKSFVDTINKLPLDEKILELSRKGKYIIIKLKKSFLVIHLRMTGQIIIYNEENFSKKHLRLSIKFNSGKFFNFYDARKFGRMYHVENLNNILANVGIDALSEEFTPQSFYILLNKHNRKIKAFLLDQRLISGLGNIYSDECLFLSGINPQTFSQNLSDSKAKTLHNNIIKTLKQAIKNMGTTISDYKTTGAGFGGFQNHLKVYGREGLSCLNCNSKIIKIRLNGRGTHFCPTCQNKNGVIN